MRGFLLAAMVLAGLDVVLKAPTTRVAAALATPAAWLATWMDARTPLIAGTAPAAPPAAGQSGGGGTDVLGEPVTKGPDTVTPVNGICPTGYLAIGNTCYKEVGM